MENSSPSVRVQCPDCVQCQMCSNARCRICRKGDHTTSSPLPGIGITHGAYLQWKQERDARLSGSKE